MNIITNGLLILVRIAILTVMLVTANWINDYLQEKISASEQAELLTAAGFPLEDTVELPNGDIRQDFEMTSNRGDCTCHIGLAREIAAATGNTLVEPVPSFNATGPFIEDITNVTNEEPEMCPMYSARIIQGIQVSESPEWLSTKIANRGDVPRNAVVDATNFVLFELGQPTHVFDFDKLEGGRIIVRRAKDGEEFLPLGEGATPIKLTSDDLVIADAVKPVALAGVKGGAETAVTSETKNILIETATFNPVTVRSSSRRHKISSDSSFRFERGVSPLQLASAADRLTGLLLDLSEGTLCKGSIDAGQSLPELITVEMRTEVCKQRLGVEISNDDMLQLLNTLGFASTIDSNVITSTVPFYRGDIHREIDLIEEVGRVYGYNKIPIVDDLEIRIPPFGGEAYGRQTLLNALAGMGFLECITHSLISMDAANAFLKDGQQPLVLGDERASATPALRPTIIPSLLNVRKHNADHGSSTLRLTELGSVFVIDGDSHEEHTELTIIMDADASQGINEIRGVVDALCAIISPEECVTIEPNDSAWLTPSVTINLSGKPIGTIGRLASAVESQWDLPNTVHVASIRLTNLLEQFPPVNQASHLPSQPAIERDISLIVSEDVSWNDIQSCIDGLDVQFLERLLFVTTFRGKNIDTGKKSITIRLRFRDDERTLRHEEVDGQMEDVVSVLTTSCGAEIRS